MNKFKLVSGFIFLSILFIGVFGINNQKVFAQNTFTWKMENTYTKAVLTGGGNTKDTCELNRSTKISSLPAATLSQWIYIEKCGAVSSGVGAGGAGDGGTGSAGAGGAGSAGAGNGNGLTGLQITLTNPLKAANLEDFIQAVLGAILKLLIPVLVILFIYTGFQLITARGDKEALKKAKTNFFNLVIGAILILGAWTFGSIIMNTLKEIGITA